MFQRPGPGSLATLRAAELGSEQAVTLQGCQLAPAMVCGCGVASTHRGPGTSSCGSFCPCCWAQPRSATGEFGVRVQNHHLVLVEPGTLPLPPAVELTGRLVAA